MSLRVLLFARFADLLGTPELDLDLPAGATVRDVIAAVRALPGGGSIPLEPLVAVNLEQAFSETVLQPGDEVAILPPVAGG